jgi:DNA-nicking Smr family endonuclease
MYQIGELIRFRYTGTRAKILADYLDGSYKVLLLPDNDEIIAFRDDIILEKDYRGIEKSAIEKEIGAQKLKTLSTEELFYSKEELEKRKKEKLQHKAQEKPVKEQFPVEKAKDYYIPVFKETASKNSGLWLAFAEQANDSFIIYIVNDSNISFSFEFELCLNGKVEQTLKQHIAACNYFAVSEFETEMLNDNAKISLSCPAYNLKEQLNLKFKKWISMQQDVPIIGINCRAQLMISASRFSNLKTAPGGDLSKYTKEQLKNSEKEGQNLFIKQNKAEKLAHFKKELDLHAEVLIPNYRSLNSGEILERQKKEMENYLIEAIELGANEVFIIHGLGEGVLRKTVENYLSGLKKKKLIQSFSNEYFPKYGFGATVVRI